MSKQMIARKLEMIERGENLPIFRLITVIALTTTLEHRARKANRGIPFLGEP